MTSFLISGNISIENEVFRNFFISQPIKLKFGIGIQNWMLILIFFAEKVVLGTISDNMTQKPLFYVAFWPNAS